LGAGSTACAAVGTPTLSASARTAAAAAERSVADRDGGDAAIVGRVGEATVVAAAAAGRRCKPLRAAKGAPTNAMATEGGAWKEGER